MKRKPRNWLEFEIKREGERIYSFRIVLVAAKCVILERAIRLVAEAEAKAVFTLWPLHSTRIVWLVLYIVLSD